MIDGVVLIAMCIVVAFATWWILSFLVGIVEAVCILLIPEDARADAASLLIGIVAVSALILLLRLLRVI